MALGRERSKEPIVKHRPVLIVIGILTILGAAASIPFLTEDIPMHWGLDGEVDRWGSRWNLLWLGATPLAIYLLMTWLPSIDPKKENYRKHEKTFDIIRTLIMLFTVGMVGIGVLTGLGLNLAVGRIIRLMIGLLFVGLGNYMGRIKHNHFVGIRFPWTLADEEVWRRTHRRGAFEFAGLGLLFLAAAALPDSIWAMVIPFSGLVVMLVDLTVFSWLIYRKKTNTESE